MRKDAKRASRCVEWAAEYQRQRNIDEVASLLRVSPEVFYSPPTEEDIKQIATAMVDCGAIRLKGNGKEK